MKYTIKTRDLSKRTTIFNCNKMINDKENNLITFYFNDEIVCQIKKIIEKENE